MLVFAAWIPSQSLQKKGKIGYDGHKKIKGVKLGAAVNDLDLPISVYIAPANTNDSKFYFPIMNGFEIKISYGEAITKPEVIIADSSFDTKDIREYNQERGIRSIIPVNVRNTKKMKLERTLNLIKSFLKIEAR